MNCRHLATSLLLLITGSLLAPTASAQLSYELLFDQDLNSANGCAVQLQTTGETITGIERRLSAQVDQAVGIVSRVEIETCVAGSFTLPVSLDSGYPVALNTATNSGDGIELAAARSLIVDNGGGQVQVFVVASNAITNTEDIIATIDGLDSSTPIFLGIVQAIPTLSITALIILSVLLMMIGLIMLKRRKVFGVSLLLFSSVVFAMSFAADGDLTDWTGLTPIATDPTADGPIVNNSVDLLAFFAAVEDKQVFFRLDVVDIENNLPVATAGNAATLEDAPLTITLNGTDTDGDPLTFSVGTGPLNGTLGSITQINDTSAIVEYTPDANFNGNDGFTFNVSDGNSQSAPVDFNLTVTPVNDVPSFTAGPNQTLLEDAGTQSIVWATNIIPGPANESGQALSFTITNNDNAALFADQPAVAADGTLTYTPADNANGVANITLTLADDGGTANGGVDTTAPQAFSITVTAVNDAPSFTIGPDQTVLEDAGPQTINPWASNISTGPADESAQTITGFTITDNSNPTLFAATPSVALDGSLTYTPADNANGSATISITLTDNGGTDNGGEDTSATETFVINVTSVNDAPVFTVGPDQTVLEDAGAQSLTWATGISAGPADESGQALTFTITNNDNSALFSAQPAVAADGTLTYTPANDQNGSATITLELEDNGGTADSGSDTSPSQTFSINVTAVNDAPAFTVGPDQNLLEDAGAQTINNWATSISAGPGNESSQALTFNIIDNTFPGLFLIEPAIASDGTLTYTLAPDANGSATITLTLSDNGSTANGGIDTSPSQSFSVNVIAVNDSPVFTVGPNQTVLEDAGPQTVNTWATGITAGPADEASQNISFNVTANNNPGLFSSAPMVATDGTLTYTPAPNANGSATITLELADDGGTANSGVDTSPTQDFTINVTPVNDPPMVANDAYDAVANSTLQVAAAQNVTPSVFVTGSVLDNDVDIDGPSLSASLNTATPGVTVNIAADGTFTYLPSTGMTGTDSFTYDLTDGSLTVTGTVNITFNNRVWYVDNSAVAGGTGRSTDPFDTLAEAEALQAPDDMICVLLGDGTTAGYDTGFTFLSSNVLLHGEHFGCEPALALNGNASPVSLVPPSPGDRPLIASLAGDNAVSIDTGGIGGIAIIGAAVRGLNIAGDLDAINIDASAGNPVDVTIEDNLIRAAGTHGIDVNQDIVTVAAESSTVAIVDNILTTTGDSIAISVAENAISGAFTAAIDDNTVIESNMGAGILIDGPTNDPGALIVTSFSGNTVIDAATRGIDIDRASFDAGGGTDAPGGNTSIGTIGNRVEGDGFRMNQVLGGVAFDTLDIFSNNGTGWFVRDAGSKTAGTFALSTTGGTVDTTNGTALDIDPVMVDLNFTTVSSTNANGQGSSNALGGGIFMNVTDAQGGANANALTVGTFNVTASNGNALSIINSSGLYNFGATTIDNLTVPSSGGAVRMLSNGGDNATLNFTNGFDVDMFDGGDPAGLTPGSRAIQVEAFSSGRATLSIADTANENSILIPDSAGGFIEMSAEFTTGSGRVEVGAAGIHFDSLRATGTATGEELTNDGAIRMIEVGGAGNTFNVEILEIVDGSNSSIGIEIEDSPVTYRFGNYSHQNGETVQTTPVRLTGDNGPVTFEQVNLGDNPGNPGASIGQPFSIISNNNPVSILGGTIVAGSTTAGIQLINQNNTGALTVSNTDISTTLANGGGDVLQVSGGGGTVTVSGGTFMTSTNSDGVDIQNTSATVDIGADIVHTGVAASGIVPTLIEIDNTTGNISFTGSFNNTNDGPLMLIGTNGAVGGTGTGPTNGTVSFSDTLFSGPGADGVFINNLGSNASIVFNSGASLTVNSSAVSSLNLTNNAGNITFNEAVNLLSSTNDAITLVDNTGSISINVGGSILGAGGDGVNCTNSVLDMDFLNFSNTITGDTMEVTGCTLSGSDNTAAPLVCNNGGGNSGSVSFNTGLDSCP